MTIRKLENCIISLQFCTNAHFYCLYLKVLLYPEEGWARSAVSSYWTLTPTWWNRSKCKVVEVTGTRK